MLIMMKPIWNWFGKMNIYIIKKIKDHKIAFYQQLIRQFQNFLTVIKPIQKLVWTNIYIYI